MHISAGVAQLMREKKVCEFYFNFGSVFVYRMFKKCKIQDHLDSGLFSLLLKKKLYLLCLILFDENWHFNSYKKSRL